jgi:hypothetical protein
LVWRWTADGWVWKPGLAPDARFGE